MSNDFDRAEAFRQALVDLYWEAMNKGTTNKSFDTLLEAEAWTDAAFMLVPDGAFWRVGNDGTGPDPSAYRADVLETPGSGHHVARSYHPALAIAQAALKTKDTEHGR